MELRLKTGIGGEVDKESIGRVFQEEGTACAKNGRLKQGWGIWGCLDFLWCTCSPRANTLSEGWRVGFQTLTFLVCRLEPRSPADKQLTLNPILKALLGSSWYF